MVGPCLARWGCAELSSISLWGLFHHPLDTILYASERTVRSCKYYM